MTVTEKKENRNDFMRLFLNQVEAITISDFVTLFGNSMGLLFQSTSHIIATFSNLD